MNYVTLTLLAAFVIVFLGTALVTLLGIAGLLPVKEKYLTMFASGLLLEVAAAMTWAFRSQDLSSKSQKFYDYVASVDVGDISPQSKTAEEKLNALLSTKQSLQQYQAWTVTGWAEFQDGDVSPDSAYINQIPFKRLDPNGAFSIDVLEQAHGAAGMELPNLVIDQANPDYGPAYIVLSPNGKPTHKITKHSNHRITIDEAVTVKKKTQVFGKTAPAPVPVLLPPTPPPSSPVLSTPSPSPQVP